MKKTYAQIIKEYLEENYPDWHFGYEFVNCYVIVKGKIYWCGSSADRLARQLALDGLIERDGRENGNFYSKYRALPPKVTPSPFQEEKHNLFEPKSYPQKS